MCRVSSEGLHKIGYRNGVEGFIKYTLSNPKNISGGSITCTCKMCKNKKFLHPDVVTMYFLQKKFMNKQLCWFAHGEPYVPYKTMLERVIESTSSSNNMHRVVDDNSNYYKNMIMDAMQMNQGDVGECSIVNEEPNTTTTMFFDILKDSGDPL